MKDTATDTMKESTESKVRIPKKMKKAAKMASLQKPRRLGKTPNLKAKRRMDKKKPNLILQIAMKNRKRPLKLRMTKDQRMSHTKQIPGTTLKVCNSKVQPLVVSKEIRGSIYQMPKASTRRELRVTMV